MAGDAARKWDVLVVDDEADLRQLVRLTLEFDESLVVVASASTAAEAIEAAGRVRPDLIILDHWLRGPLTGFDIVGHLRAAAPSARVILFSANDDVIDLRDGTIDAIVAKTDLSHLPEIALRILEVG
jgi:DNA-binding response OmpR family regulator